MPFSVPLMETLKNYHLENYPSYTGLAQPITAHSLIHFFCALAWAWLMLVSLNGWGRMLAKAFDVQGVPASVACSLGIAVMVWIGGFLNLVHGIYVGVLLALVCVGLLLYVLLRQQRQEEYAWLSVWKQTSKWSRIVIILALLILFFRVAATVRLGEFRADDDGSAYLVYPLKMLSAHHFASDPFSDRRVISSLGGAYLLQAFFIAVTSLAHIGMADRTLGLALMFLALLDLGRALDLSPQQISAMELIAYLVPQETFNLTFTILPISLFLSMVWIIYETSKQAESQRWRYAALMGVIGGGVISLKSTFLPYAGAIALVPYLFIFWKLKRMQTWILPVIAGLGALSVMAAWMIAMKHESGTYLYPILGRGVDYSSYGLFPSMRRFSSSRAIVRSFIQGIVLLILVVIQLISGIHDKRSKLSVSILLSAAFAITAFNLESGGDYIWRYNFSQFFTAILVFFAVQASARYIAGTQPDRWTKIGYTCAVVSLIACVFYYDVQGGRVAPFQQMRVEAILYRHNLRASLTGMQLVSPADRGAYRAVEASLPTVAVALDVTTDSFLLKDHGSRKFLLDDWPGAASPAPGWPFTHDLNDIVKFLRRNRVRYIIYGYDYAAWFDMRSCQAIPHQAHFSQLDHALEILDFVSHRQLDQLRATHFIVYDDGKIAVIDLSEPKISTEPLRANWTLQTSETEMCMQIAKRYISTHSSQGVSMNF